MLIEFDGDKWHVKFQRRIKEEEEWQEYEILARLFGSFLDNNRAALNYLAVELAKLAIVKDPTLATGPWKDRLRPEKIEFPIFNAKPKFFDEGEAKIRRLPKTYRDAIKAEQPFINDDNKGLWDLHILSAEFRHRVIHPIAVLPHKHLFRVLMDDEPVKTTDLRILVGDDPVKHDQEVMEFRTPNISEDRYDDVKPSITISVGFDHPLCRGRDSIAVINRMGNNVGSVIERFVKFFD